MVKAVWGQVVLHLLPSALVKDVSKAFQFAVVHPALAEKSGTTPAAVVSYISLSRVRGPSRTQPPRPPGGPRQANSRPAATRPQDSSAICQARTSGNNRARTTSREQDRTATPLDNPGCGVVRPHAVPKQGLHQQGAGSEQPLLQCSQVLAAPAPRKSHLQQVFLKLCPPLALWQSC